MLVKQFVKTQYLEASISMLLTAIQIKKDVWIFLYEIQYVRCGGLVVSVPATRSDRPGSESRPGASPQSGLRGGRLLCEYCTNKL